MHSRVMLPAWLTRYGEWLFDLLINLPTTDNFFRSFSVQIAAGQLFSGHCRSNGIYAKLHVYFMLLFSRLIRPRCRGYLATIFLQRYSANTDSFIAQKFRTVGKHCWKINVRVIF
jgi:hypothetical protein